MGSIQKTEEAYKELCLTPSDINYHLPTLKAYGHACNRITEFGVRWVVSTFPLLLSKPRVLRSYDLQPPSAFGAQTKIELIEDAADELGVDFRFIQGDTREVEIDETDFLFIDTWHVYEQLKAELEKHSHKVTKFIGMHDTHTFGENGEGAGHKGLRPAINEFLEKGGWEIEYETTENNGLTIIKRI